LPPNTALQLLSTGGAVTRGAAHCSLRSRGGLCPLAAGRGGLPFPVGGARS